MPSPELENAEIYSEIEDENSILIRMKITPTSRWSISIDNVQLYDANGNVYPQGIEKNSYHRTNCTGLVFRFYGTSLPIGSTFHLYYHTDSICYQEQCVWKLTGDRTSGQYWTINKEPIKTGQGDRT